MMREEAFYILKDVYNEDPKINENSMALNLSCELCDFYDALFIAMAALKERIRDDGRGDKS